MLSHRINKYLLIAVSSMGFACAAHADGGYQPYYYDRNITQYTQAPAPTPTQPLIQTVPYNRNASQPPSTVPSYAAPVSPDGITAIRDSNNIIWFSAGADYFNYKESVSPIPDGERGWMPSLDVGASYMSHNDWFFSGEGDVSFGNVPYNGAVQTTNLMTDETTESPAQATTHETIVNIDGKAGKGFELTNQFMLTPYGELGMSYWDRNILGSYGYVEDYTHYDAMAGLMAQVALSNRLVWSVDGSYGLTFASKMKTQDVPDFHIGSTGMYKVGSKLSYALTHRFDIFTTADFTHFRNVNSELQPDLKDPVPNMPNYYYAVQEPSSYTNEMATRIGIAYHFD